MISIRDKADCCGCGACASVCPKACIQMVQDEEGFLYPKTDTEKCIQCGRCDQICPFQHSLSSDSPLGAFAAKNKNMETRLQSSSGGVFYAIALQVVRNGGIVYGVAMDETCRAAKHVRVESEAELPGLLGSKYLQAEPFACYKQIKDELEQGRKVCFSGTPCQVNALHRFLKQDYPNLLLVDTICHGVPSPRLWNTYVEYVEKKYKRKVKEVNFRYKKAGWIQYGTKLAAPGNKEVFSSKNTDAYLQMFLQNYSLRYSCYDCKAKSNRISDITLGDFWGIERVNPSFYDQAGVSLVIIRSPRGKAEWDTIKNDFEFLTAEYQAAIQYNSAEFKSVNMPEYRKRFFSDLQSRGFSSVARQQQEKKSTHEIIKQYLRRIKKMIRGGGFSAEDHSPYGILFRFESEKSRSTASLFQPFIGSGRFRVSFIRIMASLEVFADDAKKSKRHYSGL